MRSLVLRRTNKEASKLVDEYVTLLGSRDGWNGQDNVWRLRDGRIIDIGGVQFEDDKQKYKGVAHDLICFDEISDFTESQYRFISAWNRTTDPNQRCRIVAAGNPPTQPHGYWVLKYWGPWVDKNHHNPAKPGELRWYTTSNGEDTEVDGPGPHLVDGDMVRARSRTFIPASLNSNIFFDGKNYDAVLAALPAELRSAYRDGNFDTVMKDDDYQVIPSAWIQAAQDRWKARGGRPPAGVPMSAMALDVAQGGSDHTALAMRYDAHFIRPVVLKGTETPDGSTAAAGVFTHRRNNAEVVVDVGGGYGGAVIERLKDNGIRPIPFNGSKASGKRTADGGKLTFANQRAEAHWRFREALNPDQPGGSPIELPDDAIIRADLAAPHWRLTANGILIEEKIEIKKRIGRSPDVGDAIIMCWHKGQGALHHQIRHPTKHNAPWENHSAGSVGTWENRGGRSVQTNYKDSARGWSSRRNRDQRPGGSKGGEIWAKDPSWK
jgi:hypothetical protein